MKRLLVPLIGLGFLVGSSLSAQSELDKKRQVLEKSLTAEQKRLLDDYVNLQFGQEARHIDPAAGGILPSIPELRKELMDRLADMPADKAKKFWRDLPYSIKKGFRDLTPLHVLAEDRKAAERLPATAKEEVAMLLSDDLDKVMAARRKILGYGPACRALLVDQLSTLAGNSPKRLRHQDILAKLDFEEAHEWRMRIADRPLAKAAVLEKAREKGAPMVAVLVARSVCDLGYHNDVYGRMCYYNFTYFNHDYKAGVGLGFGNGDGNVLAVNFYVGQDNRLCDLGAVKYGNIKKAPGPETTAKWWKNGNPPLTAVVGHVYLLHLVHLRDHVDFTVKFKVLDLSDDEWIIIEWERIPQEK
jgi:hypothetical protein